MASSVNTMMHAVRGYFRFAHIDGLSVSDPAIYARLPKIHSGETRTHGLDRLEDPRPSRRPRTTEHYDRARGNLDRHGVHFLTAYVAGI